MPTIDLRGPNGNAFYLIGCVKTWGRQLNVPTDDVIADMMSGDYDHLLQAMQDWCDKNHIDLELIDNEDEDDFDDE